MTVTHVRVPALGCLLAAALLSAAGPASARNDKLLLPVDVGLRSNATRQVLAPDIAMRFGKASAQGLAIEGGASVHAVADPFGGNSGSNNGGRRDRRGDDVVCHDAFRKAVVELQAKARSAGATAVVGIVSNYNNMEMDSPSVFECHIGMSRGVVDLRGQFTRGGVAAQPAAMVAPRVAPPQAGAQDVAVAAAAPQPGRIASGFAAIDDVDAIPYLSDRGRQDYRSWLSMPTPKAFAISSTGFYYYTSGLKPKDTTLPVDPNERAVMGCERNAKVACKLYAVNGSVVWSK